MEQLTRRRNRVELPEGLVAVNREVAEVFDDFHLGEHRRTDCVAKCWLVDERAQVVLIRQL